MSDVTPATDGPNLDDPDTGDATTTVADDSHLSTGSDNPFTLANAKKAYAGGIAGAVVAIGALNLGGVVAQGHLDLNAIGADAGAVIVGFVVGFFGTWFPSNAK